MTDVPNFVEKYPKINYCNAMWHPSLSSVSKARNHWGYFNETWCEDTFGQYALSFF
jgi:hypothetical protein